MTLEMHFHVVNLVQHRVSPEVMFILHRVTVCPVLIPKLVMLTLSVHYEPLNSN